MDSTGAVSKNTFWSILGQLVKIFLFFVSIPILTRKLGPTNYGILVLSQSFLGVLNLLSLNTKPAAIKYLAESIKERNNDNVSRLFSNIFAITLFISIALIPFFIFLSRPIVNVLSGIDQYESTIAINCLRASVILWSISSLLDPLTAFLEANNDFKITTIISTLDAVLTTLLGIVCIMRGGDIIQYIFVFCLVRVFIFFFTSIVIRKKYCYLRIIPSLDIQYIRKVMIFGTWMSVYGFGSAVFENGSKYLIGILLSVAQVGIFSNIISVYQKVHELLGSIGRVLLPVFCQHNQKSSIEEKCHLYLSSQWILTIIAFFIYINIGMFGYSIFRIWLGIETARVFNLICPFLTISFLFHATGIVRHSLMTAYGDYKFIAFNGWLAAVLGLLSISVFIPINNILGASFGYLPIILTGHITWYFIHKKHFPSFNLVASYIATFLLPILGSGYIVLLSFFKPINLSPMLLVPVASISGLVIFMFLAFIDSLRFGSFAEGLIIVYIKDYSQRIFNRRK